ncbi:hypothetical protein Tco_0695725 [Tanacetum coccineum]
MDITSTNKTIEVKVHRKWVSKSVLDPTPIAFFYILIDRELICIALVDYMECVLRVEELIESTNHNTNITIRRVSGIKNLNASCIEITIWSEIATRYKVRCDLMEVERQRFGDREWEHMRNMVALATLLVQNSLSYQIKSIDSRIRLTNDSTIIMINQKKAWYYTTYSISPKKVNANDFALMYADHRSQLYPGRRSAFDTFKEFKKLVENELRRQLECSERIEEENSFNVIHAILCMMKATSMPQNFWAEAVRRPYMHLKTTFPIKSIRGQSLPYEAIKQRKLNLGNLKNFRMHSIFERLPYKHLTK